MKDFFKNIQNLIILVLVVLLLLQRSCSSNNPPQPQPTPEVDIQIEYDTIREEIPKYVPTFIDRVEIQHDTFSLPIDTPQVLANYFAKNYYVDTVWVDTIGYAVIRDTLTHNLITSRSVVSNFVIPTITTTYTNWKNPREFYIGVDLGGNQSQLSHIGGKLLFRAKNNRAYSLGIGLNKEFQPVISGGMFWKIGK